MRGPRDLAGWEGGTTLQWTKIANYRIKRQPPAPALRLLRVKELTFTGPLSELKSAGRLAAWPRGNTDPAGLKPSQLGRWLFNIMLWHKNGFVFTAPPNAENVVRPSVVRSGALSMPLVSSRLARTSSLSEIENLTLVRASEEATVVKVCVRVRVRSRSPEQRGEKK